MDIGIDKILAITLSGIAIILSVYNFNRAKAVTLYQDLDRLYLELLKLGIINPNFVNPGLTQDYPNKFTSDQRLQYELYAFMSWNICETIYDRKPNKKFFKTWECIIKVENKLHRKWFDMDENHCRFKKEFIEYVRQLPPEA
jgi:hypothetical protein